MNKLPTVKLQNPPRMADFATLSVAVEKGLGLKLVLSYLPMLAIAISQVLSN
jgi:hypothetical protein